MDVTIDGCTGTYGCRPDPSPIGAIGPGEDDALCDPFGDTANGVFLGLNRTIDLLRQGGLVTNSDWRSQSGNCFQQAVRD